MENTTRSLSKVLENISTEAEGAEFIRKNVSDMTFTSYLNDYIGRNNLQIPDIISDSSLNTSYVYNILNGDKNPSRDKVISLCIGMHMNYSQIQRALELAKHAPLYPKDERDARIAIAVNTGAKTVVKVNLYLEEHKQKLL